MTVRPPLSSLNTTGLNKTGLDFTDLRAAFAALKQTGLLGPQPLRSALQLAHCLLRHGASLYALANWNAERWPERTAIHDADGAVSFGELTERADHLARRLRLFIEAEQGTGDPRTLGLLCRNHASFVALLLACSRLGLNAVLLNTSFSAVQVKAACQAEGAGLLICDDEFSSGLQDAGLRILPLSEVQTPGVQTPSPATEPPGSHRHPGRPRWSRSARASLVLLTSGTTGKPRGVRRTPHLPSLLRTLTFLLGELRPCSGAPTLLTLPLFHGHGLATLGLSLTLAAPLHLLARAGPEDHWRCLHEHRIEVLVLVPTVLYRLLHAPHAPFGYDSPPCLRTVVSGSAPLGAELATQALKTFGPVLYNLYGSSEGGLISLATPHDLLAAPGTVGRIVPGVEVKVRHTGSGSPEAARTAVPAGEVGRVTVCGDLVAYVGGLSTGDFFETGDLGRFGASGLLFLVGRQDDLLVIGGENVYPEMIEERLAQLPYVLECAVSGLPSAEYGQAVHAHFVLAPGGVDRLTLEDDLKRLLPRMLRPAQISVVETLPRNLLGKLLRPQLGGPSS